MILSCSYDPDGKGKYMSNVVINSISQVHEWHGLDAPDNPLITLVEHSKLDETKSFAGYTFEMGLYMVALKELPAETSLKYGRGSYDFEQGTMIFLAPGQTMTVETDDAPVDGWGLYFHPDLIRKAQLGSRISRYTFFEYAANEALHLSEKEKVNLYAIVEKIREEYSANMDAHSLTIINSNVELLLNYCDRYFQRQFTTRGAQNSDVIARFENWLNEYFASADLATKGLPDVKTCAQAMHYSPNYLSDLLRQETGKSTLEHIHYHLVEDAKTALASTDKSVKEIAFSFGYHYPQQFSRLFKKETGVSPVEYRKQFSAN